MDVCTVPGFDTCLWSCWVQLLPPGPGSGRLRQWAGSDSGSAGSFSDDSAQWGLLKVAGTERRLYICEIRRADLNFIDRGERDHSYGRQVRASLPLRCRWGESDR